MRKTAERMRAESVVMTVLELAANARWDAKELRIQLRGRLRFERRQGWKGNYGMWRRAVIALTGVSVGRLEKRQLLLPVGGDN